MTTAQSRRPRAPRRAAARPVSFVSCDTFTPREFATWTAQQTDACRYELIHGHIVREPPARWEHGECDALIAAALVPFVRQRRLGRVFDASVGIELPSGDTVQPDLAFVSARRWRQAPQSAGTFLRLVPDLMVEVLSPSTARRDRTDKREIYERNGVREYWVVDPDLRVVTRFSLAAGRFDAGTTFAEGQELRSVVLRGFRVAVAELFPAS